jgi:hypothetical protein
MFVLYYFVLWILKNDEWKFNFTTYVREKRCKHANLVSVHSGLKYMSLHIFEIFHHQNSLGVFSGLFSCLVLVLHQLPNLFSMETWTWYFYIFKYISSFIHPTYYVKQYSKRYEIFPLNTVLILIVLLPILSSWYAFSIDIWSNKKVFNSIT